MTHLCHATMAAELAAMRAEDLRDRASNDRRVATSRTRTRRPLPRRRD